MKESVWIPSDGWTLHGIVHLPEKAPEWRVGVVVMLENHNTKFGAHGLYLELGEALAQAGIHVLRYDNRGMCDSPGICELTFANRVADARAVVSFFRRNYGLDIVLAWGLCMGAATALYSVAGANSPEQKLDGLILCNILAHPSMASLPQFAYREVDLPSLTKNIFQHENPLRKLWRALWSRENWTKKGPTLLRRYLRSEPELKRLCKAISRVGELLATCEEPILLIFGEKDRYWAAFRERVNPGDRLGLTKKKSPLMWAVVKGGDHTFSSREQTAEMLRYTLDWVKPFLRGTAVV